MKILFVLHLPPPVHGAAMVGQCIHDSELINSEFDCHYINLTTASSLDDIGKMNYRKILVFVQLLKMIWHEVRVVKPEMVYVTPNAKGRPFYKDFIVVELLKLLGCKVVVHYHNKGVASRQGRWLDDKLYRAFFRKLKVILLSESLYSDVCKYVERKDVFFCPNGISNNNHQSNKIAGPNKQLRLLFLSNLIEKKGVFVLLDALQILKIKGNSFICDFVGGGTSEIDAATLNREIAQRGLNETTFYRGEKFGEAKEECLNQADIFVFPTYYDNECFPLVLLEAMSYGLPCVTTREGAISDIIDDGVNGLIAERADAESLAEKIEILLSDNELRFMMGKAGREKFMKEFTLDMFEHRMNRILKKLTEC